ncbi:MAG TPA: hypothetical protein EYP25_01815 [Anaerolineae bacterium]|nr:hypothetical protein [Anaerolineae bacterium]
MTSPRKRLLLLILLLPGLLMACATQPAPTPTQAPTAPVSTPPAAEPTPAQAPEVEDIGIAAADIALDVGDLAESWQVVAAPATPFDNMHAPGPSGLPAHIQVLFNGVSDPWAREPGAPVIYIIPIDAYRQLWMDHDSQQVPDILQRIATLSAQLPEPRPTRGLPVLPLEETYGVNDFATQLRQPPLKETSASKMGFRFVGRFAMDATPVTNEGWRYIYQGVTRDGRYLIALFFPVRTDQLPDGIEAVSQAEQDAFSQNGLGYLADKARALDALSSSAWSPDLAALDALAASLQIR